jgi:magnesium chelatase subunit I
LIHELIEQVAIEARRSDFVDRASGVSARMAISYLETVHSNAELRMFTNAETEGAVRISDLFQGMTALTGKIELVHKGEQEGLTNVALHLIGRAVKELFNSRHVPGEKKRGRDRKGEFSRFQPIIDWFENGNILEVGMMTPTKELRATLEQIPELRSIARDLAKPKNDHELLLAMEFIVEGLHQNFLLTKKIVDARIRYTDAVSYMMNELTE